MIVHLVNKADSRADILSNRIEEEILDSFQGVLGKSVGGRREEILLGIIKR
jgi:hypothetical protein